MGEVPAQARRRPRPAPIGEASNWRTAVKCGPQSLLNYRRGSGSLIRIEKSHPVASARRSFEARPGCSLGAAVVPGRRRRSAAAEERRARPPVQESA